MSYRNELQDRRVTAIELSWSPRFILAFNPHFTKINLGPSIQYQNKFWTPELNSMAVDRRVGKRACTEHDVSFDLIARSPTTYFSSVKTQVLAVLKKLS